MTRSTDTHATKTGALALEYLRWDDAGMPIVPGPVTTNAALEDIKALISERDALSERVRVLEDNLATILDAYRLAMMALGRDAAAFDRSQEVIAARAALAGGGK